MHELMAVERTISRGVDHPWDGSKREGGFDTLEYQCDTIEESRAFVAKAEKLFWHSWLTHAECLDEKGERTGKFGGIMYKPSGITEPWEDSPEKPHPGRQKEVDGVDHD